MHFFSCKKMHECFFKKTQSFKVTSRIAVGSSLFLAEEFCCVAVVLLLCFYCVSIVFLLCCCCVSIVLLLCCCRVAVVLLSSPSHLRTQLVVFLRIICWNLNLKLKFGFA